jgi:hypothetical protein
MGREQLLDFVERRAGVAGLCKDPSAIFCHGSALEGVPLVNKRVLEPTRLTQRLVTPPETGQRQTPRCMHAPVVLACAPCGG